MAEQTFNQEQMAGMLDTRRSPVYPTHVSEFERSLREPSLLVLLRYAQLVGISTDGRTPTAADLKAAFPALTQLDNELCEAIDRDLEELTRR